jgi:hypothetical protein
VLKDNRLLVGLGIGLIIGAILLELMNVAITGVDQHTLLNGSVSDGKQYTPEELKDIADSLEYNIIEKSAVFYTQDEMDQAIRKAKEPIVKEPIVKNPNVKVPVVKEPVVKEPAEIPVTGKTISYQVNIKTGMVTEDVTDLLITAGLITDADSFQKELGRRKLNNNIQVGKFEFTKKPSLTELINIITSQ